MVFYGFLGFAGVAILVVEAKKTKPSARTLAIIMLFFICKLLKINTLKQKMSLAQRDGKYIKKCRMMNVECGIFLGKRLQMVIVVLGSKFKFQVSGFKFQVLV